MAADDEPVWNVDLEVALFHAMRRHKPVGVNRHFEMMRIVEKFNGSVSRRFSSKHLWHHLNSLYDLSALNESEPLPFPNKETTFKLPDPEYGDWVERDFPRMPVAALDREAPQATEYHVKEPREEKKEERRPDKNSDKGRGKSGTLPATPASVRDRDMEDSPKTQRKRTRGQVSASNSPATETTPSNKRPRRI